MSSVTVSSVLPVGQALCWFTPRLPFPDGRGWNGVLGSPLEEGVMLGPWCSQESSLEADAPREAHEPLARGCTGLFPKWMSVLLLLVNLFLQTKMGS